MREQDGHSPVWRSSRGTFAFVAVLLLALNIGGLAPPATRQFTRFVFTAENGPVELLTFVLLILGGVRGLLLARAAHRLGLGRATVAFYGAFAVGLIIVGMEEVSWGQWFFHWDTPAVWNEVNKQGETTLHNIGLMQGRTRLLRIVFALGGLVGVWLARVPAFATVAAPAILAPLFWIVGAQASLSLLMQAVAPSSLVYKGLFRETAELMELYIAFAAWVYMVLNARRIAESTHAKASVSREIEVGDA
jgi:hypothetical protein